MSYLLITCLIKYELYCNLLDGGEAGKTFDVCFQQLKAFAGESLYLFVSLIYIHCQYKFFTLLTDQKS